MNLLREREKRERRERERDFGLAGSACVFRCRECIVVWKGEQSLLLILIHTSLERINGLNHERELIVLSCYV